MGITPLSANLDCNILEFPAGVSGGGQGMADTFGAGLWGEALGARPSVSGPIVASVARDGNVQFALARKVKKTYETSHRRKSSGTGLTSMDCAVSACTPGANA